MNEEKETQRKQTPSIDPKQAARLLGAHVSTVYRLILHGIFRFATTCADLIRSLRAVREEPAELCRLTPAMMGRPAGTGAALTLSELASAAELAGLAAGTALSTIDDKAGPIIRRIASSEVA